MTGSGDGQCPGAEARSRVSFHAPRKWVRVLSIIVLSGVTAGCSGSARVSGFSLPSFGLSAKSPLGVRASRRVVPVHASNFGNSLPKGGGVRKLGKPYAIAGRWYTPRENPHYDKAGIASWYGTDFHGRQTANGEIYDMNALTAAHKTLPLPSYAYVTNTRNNRTVLVRINDRGPYAGNRIIDLSRATAKALDLQRAGIGQVRVQYAGPAPLDGNDHHERRFLAAQSWTQSTRMSSLRRSNQSRRPGQYARLQSYAPGWDTHRYRQSLGRAR